VDLQVKAAMPCEVEAVCAAAGALQTIGILSTVKAKRANEIVRVKITAKDRVIASGVFLGLRILKWNQDEEGYQGLIDAECNHAKGVPWPAWVTKYAALVSLTASQFVQKVKKVFGQKRIKTTLELYVYEVGELRVADESERPARYYGCPIRYVRRESHSAANPRPSSLSSSKPTCLSSKPKQGLSYNAFRTSVKGMGYTLEEMRQAYWAQK